MLMNSGYWLVIAENIWLSKLLNIAFAEQDDPANMLRLAAA